MGPPYAADGKGLLDCCVHCCLGWRETLWTAKAPVHCRDGLQTACVWTSAVGKELSLQQCRSVVRSRFVRRGLCVSRVVSAVNIVTISASCSSIHVFSLPDMPPFPSCSMVRAAFLSRCKRQPPDVSHSRAVPCRSIFLLFCTCGSNDGPRPVALGAMCVHNADRNCCCPECVGVRARPMSAAPADQNA